VRQDKKACHTAAEWEAFAKGRWTHRLIPWIDCWGNCNHGEVDFYLTQMLSGHAAFEHISKELDTKTCPTVQVGMECQKMRSKQFFSVHISQPNERS